MSDFELIPGDDALSVDERVAALESVDDPGASEQVVPFGRGWQFDFNTGQIVNNGGGNVLVTGLNQLQVWIQAQLSTAFGAHVIYAAPVGSRVLPNAIGQPVSSGLLSRIAKDIEDALLLHDRITAVTNFAFSREATSSFVEIKFTVVYDEGDELAITYNPGQV